MERNTFLNRIAQALGTSRPPLDAADPHTAAQVVSAATGKSSSRRKQLMETLQASARELNITLRQFNTPAEAGQAVLQLVRNRQPEWSDRREVVAWDHPLVTQLGLEKKLADSGSGYHITTSYADGSDHPRDDGEALRRQTVDTAARALVGVTAADFCLADTATLVMKTRPGQARSVSLLPSIHVAVIPEDRIIADFRELCYLLSFEEKEHREGLTNCMTLISGPSKTADIEVVMVEGVHGPREVHIYLIQESL
jgi:L-lactate dehydrogenase complex protein LldG